MRIPTMARSIAASNNRPNYIYILSLALYLTANDMGYVLLECDRKVYETTKERRSERRRKKERKGAENKEEEKIEMKYWVARPIRGLSMYDERKTKTRDDSEATSYGSISVRRRKGGVVTQAMRSIHSLY